MARSLGGLDLAGPETRVVTFTMPSGEKQKVKVDQSVLGLEKFKTGVGTLVAEGKEEKEFDGEKYIMERSIVSDISLVKATLDGLSRLKTLVPTL